MAETARRIICEIKTIFFITMVCMACLSWVNNARKLFALDMTEATKMEQVCRVIGIPVVPLGILFGWI